MTTPILLAAACLAGNLTCATNLPAGRAEPKSADVAACAHLGAGYVRAPGSDTCYKLGGSVRSEGMTTLGR
ncbi:porin [Lichenihabitans sp. Uapishka_5]|uniref:hypothetical protein n=1 Tax=Lichenihabitans sp. Uapishka_5 TaxID=3037302 RepID=UPI0029E81099|nr:hypothetical protein [Lichenihabitans sp. Uapishka_5]MDX7951036.1 porin [Lichenihabitans sp. Uapishka_5]